MQKLQSIEQNIASFSFLFFGSKYHLALLVVVSIVRHDNIASQQAYIAFISYCGHLAIILVGMRKNPQDGKKFDRDQE